LLRLFIYVAGHRHVAPRISAAAPVGQRSFRRRKALDGRQLMRRFYPAQPLRDLDMHRGRHRIGIVIGAALNVAWTTGSPVTL
jgi:hypothetical protein